MKIFLRDTNPEMAEAWKVWFNGVADIEVSVGDIFEGPKANAIISPANSYGFMDGGIDLAYSKKFGWGLQKDLQKIINDEHYGELPVGQAVIVSTGNDDFPWCISAPTMRIPMPVAGTMNAYLAFRASLIAVIKHGMGNVPIESIICPGLGTSVGQMSANVCAKQMFYAYMVVIKKQRKEINHLGDAVNLHYSLTRNS